MKIRPVGAEFLLADRQTDITKLIVAFCYSTERNGLLNLNPHFSVRSTIQYIMLQAREHRFCNRKPFGNYTKPIIATPAVVMCLTFRNLVTCPQ